MIYSKDMRERISVESKGKVVESLEWEEWDRAGVGGGYWVMTFTDGTEFSFRFMAEIVSP
jgi:hypothetical protein